MEQLSYNIVALLQKQNRHAREIAKALGINHMSVSRKLKELQEENIVDYRTEGKNNVYFIKNTVEAQEFQKMLEHNKLINLIRKHPRIRRIVEKVKESDVPIAMFFGSYVKGEETEKSDIDLYIHTRSTKIRDKIKLLDSKLSVKIGYFDKESLLIKEIIKNHVIIKGVDKYYEFLHQKTS